MQNKSVITEKELFDWAIEVERRGAGEILFTSMDHDGTKMGYATEVYRRLSQIVGIPIIASGGAGNGEGCADAALAASIFHFGEVNIPKLKVELQNAGIPIRII